MKKLVVFLLIAGVTVGAAFADPIGLKVYIDGFSFGNVAGDEYKFSGEGGEAAVTPGIEYGTSFLDDSLALTASLQDEIVLSDPLSQDLRLNLNVGYTLEPADAASLTFSVWDYFHLTGEDDAFAKADEGNVHTRIGVGVNFVQSLDFGDVWATLDVEFHKSFEEGAELGITTGDDNAFAVGVDSNFGLYGSVDFKIAFNDVGAAILLELPEAKPGLTGTSIGVGYKTGNIDGSVKVDIPLYENGLDEGIGITPNFTYSDIVPGLEAYLELEISNVGATADDAKIGFTPTVGVSYSF
jgi:hypothetical protein